VSTERQPQSGPDDGNDRARAERRAADETRAMHTDPERTDAARPAAGGYVPGAARGRIRVGINWGAAFFGWIAAVGSAVILTAFVVAVGAAVGVTRGATTVQEASNQISQQDPQTIGVAGLILLVVVAFVSYYCGGYVAARMSRFEGARQGFGVWVWAIIVALVVAIVAALAGARYDVLTTLNTFPRLPVNQGDLTGTGLVAVLGLLVITLLGAVIGGAAGMRYHRKLESAEAEFVDPR
jgi:amino acid transporter